MRVSAGQGHSSGQQRAMLLAATFLGLTHTGAQAQVLEEIVVTSQKREQNLQDVGISITAFAGDQIQKLGMTITTDIAAQTPNVNIVQDHPTVTTVNIRGVGQNDFADHHEPPVAAYVDEAYVSSMGILAGQMFDLERVEVLRGPQGTLFGRNATGGLIHFVSRRPEQEASGYGELTLADYNQVAFQGALGGGITDSIAGRLAVATNYHDGWMRNRIGRDLNDSKAYAVRGQVRFEFSDSSNLLLKGHYASDDTTGQGYNSRPNGVDSQGFGVGVGPNELGVFPDFFGGTFTTCPGCNAHGYNYGSDRDPRSNAYDNVGYFERDIAGATARFSNDFAGFTLTAISDYFQMDKAYNTEVDGSPLPSHSYFTDQDMNQFSQELRLSGTLDKLDWTAGAYYLRIDSDSAGGVNPLDIGPFLLSPDRIELYSDFIATLKTDSWAVFAQGEYTVAEEWRVIAGLRYTDDVKTVDYVLQNNFGLLQRFAPSTDPGAEQKFQNYSAKLQLNWEPNDATLVYVGYNRGHKAGSFSFPFVGPVAFANLPHDEEVLTSLEIGYKGSLWGGRARLNADVYYYDYEDHQASFFVNFANIIGNLDATALGGEIELVLSPTDRLELLLGFSAQDTETKDVGLPDGTVQDRELSTAPSYGVNGLVRYTWPIGSGYLAAQADFDYVDDSCFSVVCHPSEKESSYTTVNARITYGPDDERWSVAAFVRNLTDDDHRLFAADSAFVGFQGQSMSPPRWAGVTLTFRWQ